MRTEQPTKMFCTTSETEGEIVHVKLVYPPPPAPSNSLMTVDLLWFSVACFWCQSFGDVSPFMCSSYFSSVWVAVWPPLGK